MYSVILFKTLSSPASSPVLKMVPNFVSLGKAKRTPTWCFLTPNPSSLFMSVAKKGPSTRMLASKVDANDDIAKYPVDEEDPVFASKAYTDDDKEKYPLANKNDLYSVDWAPVNVMKIQKKYREADEAFIDEYGPPEETKDFFYKKVMKFFPHYMAEEEKAFVLWVKMSGMAKEEVEIIFEMDTLFINSRGEKSYFYSNELAISSAVLNEVEAKAWMYEDGHLEVMVPRVDDVNPMKKKYLVIIKVVGLVMFVFS